MVDILNHVQEIDSTEWAQKISALGLKKIGEIDKKFHSFVLILLAAYFGCDGYGDGDNKVIWSGEFIYGLYCALQLNTVLNSTAFTKPI